MLAYIISIRSTWFVLYDIIQCRHAVCVIDDVITAPTAGIVHYLGTNTY